MNKNKTHRMVHIAILSAVSVVLMFFDFPLPFFPPFLKLDASDGVIFISSVFVGPCGMVAIIFLRSFLYWLLRGAETGIPVGALVSIISSSVFCLTTYFMFKQLSRMTSARKRLVVSLTVGSVAMSIVLFILNYFWVTPFYFSLAQWPLPANYMMYMLVYIPFNLIKGAVNGLVVYVLAPYLLHRQATRKQDDVSRAI